MSEKNHHLTMMGTIHFRHVRDDSLDITVPLHSMLDADSITVFILP